MTSALKHSLDYLYVASGLMVEWGSTVRLAQSHWSRDKVKQAEFLPSAWGLVVRLGPHTDKVLRNTHSARQPHLAGHPAPEIAFPA